MPKRKCGLKCEIFSRIVGYYRPLDDWNIGKRAEFRERRMFKIDEEKLRREERR